MKNSEIHTRKIMNYLHKEMSPAEEKKFDQECEKDSNLREELLLHQEVDQAILNEIKVSEFKNQIKRIHQQTFEKKQGKVINLQNKWYWAAASITIFTGSAFFTLSKQGHHANKLFNNYYKTYTPALTTRSASSDLANAKIIQAYESGNYNLALNLLNSLRGDTIHNPQLVLIKGCAYMETDNFESAIRVFKQFNSADYTLYTESGIWYKALCYVKLKQWDKAQKTLTQIIELSGTYSENAKDLLTKIN